MIGSTSPSCELFVEGPDDLHAIGQLLLRRGFDRLAIPAFKESGSKKEVLRAIRVAVRAATGGVGRLRSGRQRRSSGNLGVRKVPPQRCRCQNPDRDPGERIRGRIRGLRDPRGGVAHSRQSPNRSFGRLLADLIDEGDPLFPHAEDAAGRAKELGARFASTAAQKAVLHTWLAWQKEPGRPYGVAIKARYFGATGAAADRFLAWFERVFGVGPSE